MSSLVSVSSSLGLTCWLVLSRQRENPSRLIYFIYWVFDGLKPVYGSRFFSLNNNKKKSWLCCQLHQVMGLPRRQQIIRRSPSCHQVLSLPKSDNEGISGGAV